MGRLSIGKAEFQSNQSQARTTIRAWAAKECQSFDSAISGEKASSLFDVPAIDSKAVTSLLAELEPVLGCKLPSRLIQRGGYANPAELEEKLMKKIESESGPSIPLPRSLAEATTIRRVEKIL